jgi:LEA14-like dessication related protein
MTARLAALSLAALTACAGSRPPPPPVNVPVLSPRVTLRAADVVGTRFEGVEVALKLDVENPNPFALPVVRVNYSVTVEGVAAFAGLAPVNAAVASQGTYPVTLQLFLPYGKIPTIAERMASGQPLAYGVSGTVGVQTPAGVMDLPIAWTGTMPLPRPAEFAFEGVEVEALSALTLSFDVKLRITNPNSYALPPGVLGHHLAVAGTPVASGDRKLPGVPPNGTAVVKIPCQVNPLGVGAGAVKAVYAALMGSEVPVSLQGRATLADIPFEVKLESVIPKLR